MEIRKFQRSCKTPHGWRLATVDEAQNSIELIKQQSLLNEFERARLLDGWISHDLQPNVGFKSCLGYMLLVQCRIQEVCGSADMVMDLYSDVNLDEEGMRAAFILCCEDWNYEVVYWLLNRWSKDKNQKFGLTENAGSSTDMMHMMQRSSEEVSKAATILHSTRPMERVPKTDFTRGSMRSMVSDILNSFHQEIEDIEPLDALFWRILALDVGGLCWNEMGLRLDLARFQEFGFNVKEDWEKIADIVWYVVADSLSVVTVHDFVFRKHIEIDRLGSTSQKMDDQGFVVSILSCANQLLVKPFSGSDTPWRVVKKAATKAAGNCQSLKLIMRKEGYGTFSYEGKYGILNSVLVGAAKRGDANLVERLVEYGVQPLDTDDPRKKTALHHAAHLGNTDNAFRIASTLLNGGKGTSKDLTNAMDHKQRIPLHRAAYCGNKELCELLLKYNSNIRAKDQNGKNPLHHALEREQQKDEVITVLISASRDKLPDIVTDATGEGLGRVNLVDEEDSNGKTPINLAIECQDNNVRMVARLLSESDKPEAYFEKYDLASYLRESSLNGYGTVVKKLLESGADPLERDSQRKTALHYAAEGKNERRAREIINYLLLDDDKQLKNLELARACDKYGKNVLHVAAFVGHRDICEWLVSLENEGIKLDTKDRDDQSALYYAVAGYHDDDSVLDVLLRGASGQGLTNVRMIDSSGTTPLHAAAERGNYKMVGELLSKRLIAQPEERQDYVRTADVLGQTALHKAASGGHVKVVSELLDEGAHPLEERDCDGKTALHHAVQAENEEDAMGIVKLLLNKCNETEKSLLLFASAVGIGYAEESLESNSMLKGFVLKQKEEMAKRTENLVRLAAEAGNIDMTRELLTRGANITDIHNDQWLSKLSDAGKLNVYKVQKQIVNMVEQGTDKPTLLDNLGRSAFADGLAALFLNPFVKSPITVGISGEWGMGKSSLMIQTESILLKTAAQMAFIDLLQTDEFPGSRKPKSSAKCEVKREKLRQSIESMLASKGEANIWNFLSDYRAEYHKIFKSLAVMDHRDTFENEKEEEPSQEDFKSVGKMQVKIPSILTVRYNAWNYRSESEAWAGLAVEITKELESTMTVAQRLRTNWRYTWANRRRNICVDVILPCCFAIILAIWATVILWLILDRLKDANVRTIKYGSFPLTLLAVVWTIVKSVMSVVKPISSHMLDYMSLPDHSQKLGYHHKVTNDIDFLKKEVGRKPFWLWNVFAFIWCCITFSLNDNYIPHTTIPKTTPASQNNLRMIVFVDDLDRCQENVVLKILSAVNLVLAACEINVVLGMDKSMIERAIIRMYGDKASKPDKTSQDMADKYLRKIIQLPLDLPDPSDLESLSFLDEQLGVAPSRKGASESVSGTRIQNVNARRKLNPKFRMGSFTPENPEIDTTNSLRVAEESYEILDTRSSGTFSEEQQNEELEESGCALRDATITMPSGEKECAGDSTSNTRSGISCVVLVKKLLSCFVHKQPEALRSYKTHPSDEEHSKLSPISSELLLPKYSKGERDAFYFLRDQATTSRKLPREWKRFLNYHRLAWNILLKSKEVKIVAGWHVQLIAWVFVCWQWKDRIDTLIQEWDELNVLRNWIAKNDSQREREQNSGPSLRDIVEHYMEGRWPTTTTSTSNEFSIKATLPKAVAAKEEDATNIKEELNHYSTNQSLPGEGQKAALKVENPTSEEYLNQPMTSEEGKKAGNFVQQDRKFKISKEKLSEKAEGKFKGKVNKQKDDELEEWKKLKQTLRKYNVTMDGIQAFQKFRFYCVPGHLRWPLQDSNSL